MDFSAALFSNQSSGDAMLSLEAAGVDKQGLVALLYDAHLVLKWRTELEQKRLSFADALGLKDSRSVDRLVEKLRDLADELKNAEDALGRSGFPVTWYTEPWNSGYYETLSNSPTSTSKILRAEASWIECAGQSVKRQPTVSLPEIVEDQIAGFVKKHSTRPHYSEVVTLINWLYRLPGCGGFQTTEEALSRRMSRKTVSRKAND